MKRILIILVTSVVCFVGGLGASWFLVLPQEAEEPQPGTDAVASTDLAADVPGNLAAPALKPDNDVELPVPVRGEALTAEEIFRYGAGIRSEYEAMVKRRESIEREAGRLQLLQDDIRGTREELDGLESKLVGLVEMGERLLARLEAQMSSLKQQREAVNENNVSTSDAPDPVAIDTKSVKRISEIISGMSDADAAEYLRELSNAGKLAMASEVLNQIEPRDAAKILSALDDPVLVVQLTDAVLQKQATKKR